MDDAYFVKPLGRRQIDQAFPVVSACSPGIGVERWRAFAAAVIPAADLEAAPSSPHAIVMADDSPATPAPTGIITAQSDRGYIHGLFSYAVEPDLRHGRVLTADNFVVLDLVDPDAPATVLLKAMEHLARRLGCGAIHASLPEGAAPMLNRLHHAGHHPEARRLCKPLDCVNGNQPDTDGA
ncbi:MAG TPA: hypothetical protein VEB64_05120 [Azospirillaceae bacterium]|nr:hypothetical protein [Azospirillaceae bacterium]